MKALCWFAQIAAISTIFYIAGSNVTTNMILTLLIVINNATVQFRTYLVLEPLFRSQDFR